MARIRTIKPEQPKDEELAALPIHARYLFAFLPTQADREGRLEDRPRVLKLEIFPWDEGVDVDDLLNKLSPHFIFRYSSKDGHKLIQIRQFSKHQRPNLRELPSTLPAPSEHDLKHSEHDLKHSRTCRKVPARAYKGTGREREGKGTGTTIENDGFLEFWNCYPKKVSKKDAVRAWGKIKPDEVLRARIIAAVQAQSNTDQWRKNNGQFIPHPATWLNGEKWEDHDKMPMTQTSDANETPEDRDFRIAAEKHEADKAYWAEDERKQKSEQKVRGS